MVFLFSVRFSHCLAVVVKGVFLLSKVPPPISSIGWINDVIDFLKEMFSAFISIWPWWILYLVSLFVVVIAIYMFFRYVF